MGYLLGFPVDSGSVELSFVVLVRTIRAKYHWCRNGGKSGLRTNSGAKFAFEHTPAEIQDQCRFEFEPLPTPKNAQFNKPNQLCDEGYSDFAACALAIAQYQPNQPALKTTRPVLISCSFAPNHQLNQGLTGLLLDKVTHESLENARESLYHKWKAAHHYKALALVLHEKDAALLKESPRFEPKRTVFPLEKNTFKRLLHSTNETIPIISCKTDQIALLAEALEIDSALFQNSAPVPIAATSLPKSTFFYASLYSSIGLSLVSCFFMFFLGKHILLNSQTINSANQRTITEKTKKEKEFSVLESLKSKESLIRFQALELLGKRGPSQAKFISHLIQRLSLESEKKIRRKVVWTIGEIKRESKDKRLIEILANLLKDNDPKLRVYVLNALEKIGSDLSSILLASLNDDVWYVRMEAILVLNRTDFQLLPVALKIFQALIEKLQDPNEFVRREAAWILGEKNVAEALPQLKTMYNDPSSFVRTEVIEALNKITSSK